MFFNMQKYAYSESVFNTLHIEKKKWVENLEKLRTVKYSKDVH